MPFSRSFKATFWNTNKSSLLTNASDPCRILAFLQHSHRFHHYIGYMYNVIYMLCHQYLLDTCQSQTYDTTEDEKLYKTVIDSHKSRTNALESNLFTAPPSRLMYRVFYYLHVCVNILLSTQLDTSYHINENK